MSLAALADGEPAFTVFPNGMGKVVVCNWAPGRLRKLAFRK